MSIRDSRFWKQIEPIFAENPGAGYFPSQTAHGSRVCEQGEFQNRLRQALKRVHRNKRHVFLLLMDIQSRDQGGAGAVAAGVRELMLSRVATSLRSGDSVCALNGGGLAILAEGARDPEMVSIVTARIHAAVIDPVTTEAGKVVVHPCFGAGVFPADAADEERLWQQARMALRLAVESTPDGLRFPYLVKRQVAMDRFEMNKDLYRAYRQQEFCLLYQPVFAAGGQRMSGVEVLLRWRHPLRGLLPPGAFIGSLEESGLIVPVGEWVLKQSCAMARSLADSGCPPLLFSVNISGRQMADPGFLLAVLDALYDAGMDASQLQLEFSEQVIAGDLELARRVLQELRNAGVRVAIDQFGAGMLAVADLVRLPATTIKMDRALVARLDADPLSMAIVSATTALAGGSGRAVAAVGIERSDQVELLLQAGCGEVQGTLLSQPQTAAELVERLRA